jgi:hypothetical protein
MFLKNRVEVMIIRVQRHKLGVLPCGKASGKGTYKVINGSIIGHFNSRCRSVVELKKYIENIEATKTGVHISAMDLVVTSLESQYVNIDTDKIPSNSLYAAAAYILLNSGMSYLTISKLFLSMGRKIPTKQEQLRVLDGVKRCNLLAVSSDSDSDIITKAQPSLAL